MTDLIKQLFGEGEDLEVSQMALRAVVIFFITLVLIRISGRRSFALNSAPDNIIGITLGAVLSRAIVGASPFWDVVAAGAVIAILHRLIWWGAIHSKTFKRLLIGRRIIIYEQGHFNATELRKALVCEEEIISAVIKQTNTNSLEGIKQIYIDTSGEIVILK